MTRRYDVGVIGAGMAGASLAAELAPHASVLMLEAEQFPGYHATGRSAAFWSETYGGPLVQPLTTASRTLLERPDPAFSERPFLLPRGALHIADAAGVGAVSRLLDQFAGSSVDLRKVDRAELRARVPALRDQWEQGVYEPSCADIDVAGLHAAYLRKARHEGAALITSARLRTVARGDGEWLLTVGTETYRIGILANAAGAWADEIATTAGVRAVGIRPYRRTMLQLAVNPPARPDLPLVIDARERFYLKPEAGGRLWLSPHDETPCEPCDTAPEELDVALAIQRFEQAVDWKVDRIERRWAGLRSFAPDRLPIYGFAPDAPDFFWFAGQGGFGIQTAPAAAKLAAAILLGREADRCVAHIDPAPYRAGRFMN